MGRVGVIDIGSNTVRLVVYDTPTRLPFPIFNEKAQCELGLMLNETGCLNPGGVDLAMKSLTRFISLSNAMGVERLQMVATAAVRDAEDGSEFASAVQERFGRTVQVLSGEEEARSAALGVLSGVPGADGILGDLGGGSLDLVELDRGSFGRYATLPLGHLRLAGMANQRGKGITEEIKKHMSRISWLDTVRGRSFHAVGGSWRAIARIFLDQAGYPLHVIDNYTVSLDDTTRLVRLIGGLSRGSLEKIPGVARRRLPTLPYAAKAMGALLDAVRPKEVVFSAFGMREGQMLKSLAPELRDQDPLIAACETLAERTGRFAFGDRELLDWISPLFPDETPVERRMRLAACLISDQGWTEHPDSRAEIAFQRALRLPFAGLAHADRVFLAISTFVRYNGDPDSSLVAPVRDLLDEGRRAKANVLGLALRLANTVSGGAPGLLPRTALETDGGTLRLRLPDEREVFIGEAVERRFRTLARSMGLDDEIV